MISFYRCLGFRSQSPADLGKNPALPLADAQSSWGQLLPTLIGGILAICGGFLATAWEDYQKRRALRFALAAEIRAIVDLLRPARDGTKRAVKQMKETPHAARYPTVDFRNTYSTVFSGNAQNIGLLDAVLAGEIVAYYYRFQGLIEALTILEKRKPSPNVAQDEKDRDAVISKNEQIIVMCDEIINIGADLIDRLDQPGN
jgi:hypothetical protein